MCEQEGNAPLSISEFKLDLPTALSRKLMLDDPTDGVYTSDVLNASPGVVVASNGNVVQYKCTTLPQMSGCPCVLLEKPFKLVAMHIQGGGQLDRNFNFGVSVKHIEFVRAYVLTVLPRLQKRLGQHICYRQRGYVHLARLSSGCGWLRGQVAAASHCRQVSFGCRGRGSNPWCF